MQYFQICMLFVLIFFFFFFSSRRRHTRYWRDWSSDVCSSDLLKSRRPSGEAPAAFGRLKILSGFGLRTTLAPRTPPGRERSNGSGGGVCCGSVRSLATSQRVAARQACRTAPRWSTIRRRRAEPQSRPRQLFLFCHEDTIQTPRPRPGLHPAGDGRPGARVLRPRARTRRGREAGGAQEERRHVVL